MKYALLDPEDKSVYKAVNDYVLTTINPCMNSTFFFLEHVILAIKEMHKVMFIARFILFVCQKIDGRYWQMLLLFMGYTKSNCSRNYLQ